MPKAEKIKTARRTRAELLKENEELRQSLKEKLALDHATVEAGELGAGPRMIPIKNFSQSHIVYEYQWRGLDRKLELAAKGRKQYASVPLEIWFELERDTTLVTEGYIARIDQPITNPNIVEDPAALIENMTEQEFKERVSKITNAFTLYDLVAYIEPIKNKSGKQLMAQSAIRMRVKETLGTLIVDDI